MPVGFNAVDHGIDLRYGSRFRLRRWKRGQDSSAGDRFKRDTGVSGRAEGGRCPGQTETPGVAVCAFSQGG